MVSFLESLFGASWRTSLFACLAVAFTALASVDLQPTINKIAMAAAAISTAIGLFMARDNKVSSREVLGTEATKGMTKAILILLIPALMIVGGCSKVQMSPEYKAQLDKLVPVATELDKRCVAGDCEACTTNSVKLTRNLLLWQAAVNGVDSNSVK